MHTKRVAVIGGGLAGLACAYSLRRRQVDVTLFEAAARAGGRDRAASYLLSRDLFRNTFTLIEDAGLSAHVVPISPHAGQVYKGRIFRHRVASAAGLLSFKGLNILDKALLPRMAYLLTRYSSKLDFHDPGRGLQFDDESTASFVKRELSQNILSYVAGPLISTLFFYGSEETSAWLYLVLAKHMHNVRMSTVRGGTNRIAAALAQQVKIENGRRIDRIETAGQAYIAGGQTFSDLVVAVPGDAVLGLEGIEPLLSDEDVGFFRECQYQRIVSVRVGTPRPVDGECYAVSIPRVEKFSAATISFHDYIDPSSVPEGEGLLTISGGGPDVSVDALLGDLRKLYGIDPAKTETAEFQSGMPAFPPGRFRAVAHFTKRQRRPGLHFCGDYLMGPFIEGAITTGLQAADAIEV